MHADGLLVPDAGGADGGDQEGLVRGGGCRGWGDGEGSEVVGGSYWLKDSHASLKLNMIEFVGVVEKLAEMRISAVVSGFER